MPAWIHPTALRGSIWLAMLLYTASMTIRLVGPSDANAGRFALARLIYTLGLAAFWLHVAAAFHFDHHWSLAIAYSHTAERTAELMGWESGLGLYVNFAFGLVWTADALSWWLAPERYVARSRWIEFFVHGIFVFMIANGAIVFGRGPVRAFGAALLAVLAAVSFVRLRRLRAAA